jgi:hypothetical protein
MVGAMDSSTLRQLRNECRAIGTSAASITEASTDGLAASDAAVLYATRMLGLPLVEVAELTGVSVRRLGRQRNHAIAVVVA